MAPGFQPTSIVVHPDVDAVYHALQEAAARGEKPQQGIWQRYQAALMMIRQDGQWGDVIPSPDIPQYFRTKYEVRNLFCIDLKGDVRAFYTIAGHDIVFLDIVDHDEYDKWFPPKGQKKRRR